MNCKYNIILQEVSEYMQINTIDSKKYIRKGWKGEINKETQTWYVNHLPRHRTGVFVSLKPRKMPWRAKESTTAGAPTALIERNCRAGAKVGFCCRK